MTSPGTPTVTIVTAAHNAADFIGETRLSIARQSFSDWEWIPVDDGSTDSTAELLADAAKADPRIRPISLPRNCGPAIARNTAIDAARGDYLAFIDSDDLWLPEKLSSQLKHMQETSEDFSFTAYAPFRDDPGRAYRAIDLEAPARVSYSDMLVKRATLGCSTVMVTRSLVGDRRMPLYRSGQDYAFWLRLLRPGASASLLRQVLTLYRIRPGSVSRNKFKKAARQWQIYRECERLSLSRSAFCFSQYAFRALVRS